MNQDRSRNVEHVLRQLARQGAIQMRSRLKCLRKAAAHLELRLRQDRLHDGERDLTLGLSQRLNAVKLCDAQHRILAVGRIGIRRQELYIALR